MDFRKFLKNFKIDKIKSIYNLETIKKILNK